MDYLQDFQCQERYEFIVAKSQWILQPSLQRKTKITQIVVRFLYRITEISDEQAGKQKKLEEFFVFVKSNSRFFDVVFFILFSANFQNKYPN